MKRRDGGRDRNRSNERVTAASDEASKGSPALTMFTHFSSRGRKNFSAPETHIRRLTSTQRTTIMIVVNTVSNSLGAPPVMILSMRIAVSRMIRATMKSAT